MRNRIFFATLIPFFLWAFLALVFFPALPPWLSLTGAVLWLGILLWGNWISRFSHRWLIAGACSVIAIGAAYAIQSPQGDRDWRPEQDRLARVEISGETIRITNFRDAIFYPEEGFIPQWKEAVFHLNELERLDFIQSMLSPGGAIAHGFLSFGFSDGRQVAVSIEARRRRGQTYSPIRGLFRNYELLYVLGEETDLIGSRSAIDGEPVYLYPLRASPETVQKLFLSMARKTNRLAAEPEFYNTINNNCVTTLLQHANETVEASIPYDWRILFPGFADSLLHELNLIEFEGSLAEARERFLINDRSRPITDLIDWSARIRQPPD